MKEHNDWLRRGLMLTAIFGFSLLSPKWTVSAAAFVAPAVLLILLRGLNAGRAFLICLVVLIVSNAVANHGVMPFPLIIFIVMILQMSIVQSIVYITYLRLEHRWDSWQITLLFPIFHVLLEYANSFLGGGSWGSIAYTQVSYLPIIQLASVTGIWGITFMIYWFASLAAHCYRHRWNWIPLRTPVTFYLGLVSLVVIYGSIRISASESPSDQTVKVAGISALNHYLLGIIYEDAFDKKLPFDVRGLTQSSPELQELNRGLAALIADPFAPRFRNSHAALDHFCDSMFQLAAREAKAGAKIISFSEALMFTFKPVENELIAKGQHFARTHDVTLLLTMASFIPGKAEFGTAFIENKAIMIDSLGHIEHVFFKNKPVPLVEPSVPGNGEIPIYNSLHGKLATSICYDADFPALMRQAGRQHAAIMLLPSGDWEEISPYHADMSRVRAVENGMSVMRAVSGGTLMACDQVGRVVARRTFNDDGEKVITAYLSVNGRPTLYVYLGDYFPWLCLIGGAVILVIADHRKKERSKTRSALPVNEPV